MSPDTRVYQVKKLLASLDVMSETEMEILWIEEAVHRNEELNNRRAIAHPAEAFPEPVLPENKPISIDP